MKGWRIFRHPFLQCILMSYDCYNMRILCIKVKIYTCTHVYLCKFVLAICFLMAYDNGIVNEGCFQGMRDVHRGRLIEEK